ncbi:VOC family protein [Halomarina rubra]|uniref:VOC family protein n=1 Tax=Halomarina rubra TaxID=2071873 RepID=A0ABD6B0Q4_9EURY|nr:VOC family protein [Halomarina rubra]
MGTGTGVEGASLGGLTLHVADVERSLQFYERLPGVETIQYEPGTVARLRIGDGHLTLLSLEEGQFHVRLDCTDLDGFYETCRTSGLDVPPPRDMPWGERASLAFDPDGNVVEFGQVID